MNRSFSQNPYSCEVLLGLRNVILDSGVVSDSPVLAGCLPPSFLQPPKKLV